MYYIYCVVVAIVFIATLLPLIKHNLWVFRVFEYPRLQKLFINFCSLLAGLCFYHHTSLEKVIILLLFINLAYLIYQVFPFTILGKQQIIKSRCPNGDNNVKILIANVYQHNKNSQAYLKLIDQCEADVILMVETNKWWDNEINVIASEYPHQIKIPLENTYGMIFYSKLAIRDGQINYLVEKDIPSIEVEVKLKSGVWVKLYCLHPQPPVPQENPRSTERDKEILLVGTKAKKCKMPVIVMGDLNDVAWSYTTQLFGKVSGLLDPRRGRGFFNSFNAKYFFLRFPLDHIFCSSDFTLTGIKRMQSCGSDHFPMCVNLQLDKPATVLNNEPIAEAEDLQLADEKINADI